MRKRKVATKTISRQGSLRTGTNIKQPKKASPRRAWLERLDPSRNMWLLAEGSMQKDLNTMLNIAKSNPVFLRVVVKDWKEATIVIDPSAAKVVMHKQHGECIRPGKGQKLLVLTRLQAQELPVVKQASRLQKMRDLLKIAAKAQKPVVAKPAPVRPKAAVIAKPVAPAAPDLRALIAARVPQAPASTLAYAMRRAVAA